MRSPTAGCASQSRITASGYRLTPATAHSIFTMFSQIQDVQNRTEGALGIGLALGKGLVELHGGSVEAHSEGIGRGTQFVVRLPLATPRRAPAAGDAHSHTHAAPKSGRKVLIADDNDDAAESLAMLLRLNGHEVRTAHDGDDALTLAQVFRPEVVVLDLGMPEMDSYKTGRLIRQEPWGTAVTLVAPTGWGQDRDKRRTAEAGFDHHLLKPVDLQQLENVIGCSGEKRTGRLI